MRMTNIYRTVRRDLQWKVPIWKTYKPEANFKYSPLVMVWIVPKKTYYVVLKSSIMPKY